MAGGGVESFAVEIADGAGLRERGLGLGLIEKGPLDPGDETVGDSGGRARGHQNRGVHGLGVAVLEQNELEATACKHGDRADEDGDGDRQRRVPPPEAPPRETRVGWNEQVIEEVVSGGVEPVFEPLGPALPVQRDPPVVVEQAVPHVAGQNEQRLDERDRQRHADDYRQRPEQIAQRALDQRQREKRADGGKHRRRDGPRDLLRPVNRRCERILAALMPRHDVLRHDDRVVHEDPQHHDESEHRQQVQRDAHEVHHRERPAQRDDQPDGDPERNTPVQQKHQRDKDQHPSPERVAHEQVESPHHETRQVRCDDDLARGRRTREPELIRGNPRRRRAVVARPTQQRYQTLPGRELQVLAAPTHGIGLDDLRHLHDVLRPVAHHGREHDGLTVEPSRQVDVLEPVAHVRDVAHAEDLPVVAGLDDDPPDRIGAIVGAHRAHGRVLCGRSDRPPGQLDHCLADARGDLRQAQPVRQHRLGPNLDRDLVPPDAAHENLAHALQRSKIVADLKNRRLHVALVGVANDVEHAHGEARLDGVDRDPVGTLGQILQGVDLALHLGDGLFGADLIDKLDAHRREAIGHRGVDLLDALHVAELILDLDRQRFFDLLRRRARVRRDHHHLVGPDLREKLALELGAEDQPRPQQREHAQVRDHRLAHTKGRQAHHSPPGRSSVRAAPATVCAEMRTGSP